MLEQKQKLTKHEVQIKRDETFDYNDKQEHTVGSHFDSMFDDMTEDVIKNIPELVKNSELTKEYVEDNDDIKIEDDAQWKTGYVTISPQDYLNDGIGIIYGLVDENIHLISMFPYFNYGQEYDLSIEKVYVWENGQEAQIEVDFEFTTINFYDTHFNMNRQWYFKNKKYKFQILGIAYRCEYRQETEITVDTPDKLADALELPRGTPRTYSLEGMASFIPVTQWDRDDYSFSGLITEVKDIDILFNNEKGWICTTSVLKSGIDDDLEYDIDILVTQRIWEENESPKIGDDIEGSLWLQGRLKHVYSDFDKALENLTVK